jgi:nucleoside 2-deoxyribosyltransferase
VVNERADACLILASHGLDPAAALAAARRHNSLVALDGHQDEMRAEAWRPVLRDVDVLFLNLEDAAAISGGDALTVVRVLGREERVTVIKHGRGGLTAWIAGARVNVGAYEIAMRDKVGAGDTLIGATIARRLQGYTFEQALEFGSGAAAHHIEAGTVPEPGHVEEMSTRQRVYVSPETLAAQIYVAAPFFTAAENSALKHLVDGLEAAGVRVASPSRDIGILGSDATPELTAEYFRRDLVELDRSAAVVALLDQNDTGTAWEVGYAYAKGIPSVGMRTDVRAQPNNMLVHSVAIVRGIDELLRVLFRILAR